MQDDLGNEAPWGGRPREDLFGPLGWCNAEQPALLRQAQQATAAGLGISTCRGAPQACRAKVLECHPADVSQLICCSTRCQAASAYPQCPAARTAPNAQGNAALPHHTSGRQLSAAAHSPAGAPACWMAWAVTCVTPCMRPSALRSAAATGSASRGSASERCLDVTALSVLCCLRRYVQCSGSPPLQRLQVLSRVLWP